MRHLGIILLFSLLPLSQVTADSQSLILSGYVPVRAEMRLQQSPDGKLEIISNNSEGLKVQVSKRAPASIVSVTAP